MSANFLQRGGGWVAGQFLILGAMVWLSLKFHVAGFHLWLVVSGAILLILGAGVAVAGVRTLGRNLTPFPKPGEKAQLVQRGIYSVVRHPLYTAVVSASLGWALVWQSWPAVIVALTLIPFFHAKSRREEEWLREKFPEYAEYERHVRRFVPWVY